VVEVVEVLLVVLDSGKDRVVRSESEKDCFIFLRGEEKSEFGAVMRKMSIDL